MGEAFFSLRRCLFGIAPANSGVAYKLWSLFIRVLQGECFQITRMFITISVFISRTNFHLFHFIFTPHGNAINFFSSLGGLLIILLYYFLHYFKFFVLIPPQDNGCN